MGTRRSAASLSVGEVSRFASAVQALKQPDPTTGVSVYDQFVALHSAVMAVRVTFQSGQTQVNNMAHWNIGFCPWHRQYLLSFEQALQSIDADVTIPYWDWDDHGGAISNLFDEAFAGSLGPATGPADVVNGRFAQFPIAELLREDWGTPLERGGGLDVSWPPTAGGIAWLEDLRFSAGSRHPLWILWRILEAGWPNLVTATHNAAHNFIGGHMAGGFSPNDPIFWMHHANVDRIWSRWQQNYLVANGGDHPSDWPPPDEPSPMDGLTAGYGHRVDDVMWPWVGRFSDSFLSQSVTAEQYAMVVDPATLDEVTVRDVLDITALGYDYE